MGEERKISNEPYDTTRGNPNDGVFNPDNRGNHISFRGDNTKPFSLGFTDIDEAISYYVESIIKPTVIQNGVIQKVPFIYGLSERWNQMQKDGYYRDNSNKIMCPLMIFKRDSIEPNRTLTSKLNSIYPNNVQLFTKTYSSKDAYNNFGVLNNRIPQKQYYAVVVPDYVTITYDFVIFTYYIEQLNKLIEAINYTSDDYWGNPERFKFRTRIDRFDTPIEIPNNGERIVKATFSLRLYGYVVPDNTQKQLASLKKFNSKSQVVFNLEVVENFEQAQALKTEISSNSNYTRFIDR